MTKHTKICATIGPSCQDYEVLLKMVKAGMNIARLNFSHGDYESHHELIKNIRRVEKETDEPVAIMQDLQGPKIRVGKMPAEGVKVKANHEIIFDTNLPEYKGENLPIDFPDLQEHLKAGDRMLIDDGHIEVKISAIKGSKIHAVPIDGGIILSHKGLNFPDSSLSIPALSKKDREDLEFGVEAGVDFVAMSFVRSAKDIKDLRALIKTYEHKLGIKSETEIRIIAKIEQHEAVTDIKEIIDAADGIMVARGDLGLETPAAEVPLVQKNIISIANDAAKPVIVATQMLDSMNTNRRPTRAEVSDVANAVIDHADTLMLSNETATGKYPVLTIKTMRDVIIATEKSSYDDVNLPPARKKGTDVDVAISELSRILAEEVGATVITAASLSGETGRLISHVRPSLPILVATTTERGRRQLNLSWGVIPFILPHCHTVEELIKHSITYITKHRLAKKGDKIIVVAGEAVGQSGNVNKVEVREIK